MAVTTTPMSQYNKSNPLVILSKKQYSQIMDDIQSMTKKFIQKMIFSLILIGIFGVIELLYGIFAHITVERGFLLGFFFVITLIIGFGYYLRYRTLVDYFLHRHSAMQEFDRISNLELNEILMIGNEEVLECLHNMYELYGEIYVEKKYFSYLGIFIITIYTFAICAMIASTNFIGIIFGGI